MGFYLFCEIERFRRNFQPTGYLRNVAAILNFQIFAQNGKTQIALTVQNRDFVEIFDP